MCNTAHKKREGVSISATTRQLPLLIDQAAIWMSAGQDSIVCSIHLSLKGLDMYAPKTVTVRPSDSVLTSVSVGVSV